MSFSDIFRITRYVRSSQTELKPGEARLESGEIVTPVKEGVFVTEQSLASFPGAVAAIEILGRVTHTLLPTRDQHVINAFWALLVGIVLFGISIGETWKQSTANQRGLKGLIALVNTAMLFLTATGVDATVLGAR
jgi:hypothetical protein